MECSRFYDIELFLGGIDKIRVPRKSPIERLKLCLPYISGLYSMWLPAPGNNIVWYFHIFFPFYRHDVVDDVISDKKIVTKIMSKSTGL